MQGNVYLIGPMGAGKTTVGRRLARLLGCDFIDTDQVLEKRTGVSVSHIFEVEGEQGFREREARLLEEIGRATGREIDRAINRSDNPGPGAVVATGGGIILKEANRRVMRQSGTVVYLRASPELLWARLKNCRSRPLLSASDPRSTITELLEARGPLYGAEADFTVDARAESAAKMAAKIHALLRRDEARHENPS